MCYRSVVSSVALFTIWSYFWWLSIIRSLSGFHSICKDFFRFSVTFLSIYQYKECPCSRIAHMDFPVNFFGWQIISSKYLPFSRLVLDNFPAIDLRELDASWRLFAIEKIIDAIREICRNTFSEIKFKFSYSFWSYVWHSRWEGGTWISIFSNIFIEKGPLYSSLQRKPRTVIVSCMLPS